MRKACLVCNAPNSKINIFRHVRELEDILKFLLGLQAKPGDHLCKNCCAEIINVFESKRRLSQRKQENEISPIDDRNDVVILSDSDVEIKLESEDDLEEEDFEVLKVDIKTEKSPQKVLDGNVENLTKSKENLQSQRGEESKPDFEVAIVNTQDVIQVEQDENKILDKKHTCPECGKECNTFLKLRYHLRAQHNIGKKCKKPLSNVIKHKQSTLVHTTEHGCLYCSKTFHSKKRLDNHIKCIHTKEGPHKCFECKKDFSTKSSLKRHRMIHTGEKPYTCSECEKQFTTITQLKYHEKSHIVENPNSDLTNPNPDQSIKKQNCVELKKYCCCYCSQTCQNFVSILEEIPNSRSKCKKRNGTITQLRTLKKKYAREGPYSCSYCSKRYAQKCNLARHIQNQHMTQKIKLVCKHMPVGTLRNKSRRR